MKRLLLVFGILWLLPAAPASAAGVADLAWMAGDWQSEDGGSLVQEVWTEPRAGATTAMFRIVSGGKVRVLEYVIIAEEKDGIFYQFKHFRTDYTTWEGTNPPFRLKLIEAKPGRAVFRNTIDVEGQPTYISYLLNDKKQLVIRTGGPPDESDHPDTQEFVLTRH